MEITLVRHYSVVTVGISIQYIVNSLVNAVEALSDKELEKVDRIKTIHELTTKWESDKGTSPQTFTTVCLALVHLCLEYRYA